MTQEGISELGNNKYVKDSISKKFIGIPDL